MFRALAILISAVLAGAVAQPAIPQPPSCVTASDPDYGFVKEKAIQIGGGAAYVAARERRYLDALRGPQGQTLRVLSRVTTAIDPKAPDPTILDLYQVTYEGLDQPVGLYLDAYHFSAPRAPRGFTCGAALAAALGPPPIDPFKASTAMVALAVEQGSTGRQFAPMPLEKPGELARGVVFDQFRMIALSAKAAAAAGAPLAPIDLNKPLPPIARQGLVVVAYPIPCAGHDVAPTAIEIVAAQGPAPPRSGDVVSGDAIAALLPGVSVPPMSLAARYGIAFLRPIDRVKITYPEACGEAAREAILPVTFEPPRLVTSARAVVPPGVAEADSVVYFQAIIDTDGAFQRALLLGGPEPLVIPALEALVHWRATPLLVNGAPVVTPMVVQIAVQ